jgi:large subunit ribosomal protein L25
MSSIEVNIRDTNTRGQLNKLRSNGNVPGVIYGGKEKNQKISISKKIFKTLAEKENFLSNILSIEIDGKSEKVLPKEIIWNPITDEPMHIDFLRVVKGAKIILEIPVKFINEDKSPGLKRGGVLNIVRRKIELKCPSENIPTELIVDLEGLDIGSSIKISSIKLPENVEPTIKGRDFVVATVAAPTIIKEPEKPAEAVEGEEGAEATPEGAEGEVKAADGDKKAEGGDKKAEGGEKKAEGGEKKAEGSKKPAAEKK